MCANDARKEKLVAGLSRSMSPDQTPLMKLAEGGETTDGAPSAVPLNVTRPAKLITTCSKESRASMVTPNGTVVICGEAIELTSKWSTLCVANRHTALNGELLLRNVTFQ